MHCAKTIGKDDWKLRAMVVAESGCPEAEAIVVADSRSIERAGRVELEPSERLRWQNGAGYGGDRQLLRLLPEVARTAKAVVKKKTASVVESPVAQCYQ